MICPAVVSRNEMTDSIISRSSSSTAPSFSPSSTADKISCWMSWFALPGTAAAVVAPVTRPTSRSITCIPLANGQSTQNSPCSGRTLAPMIASPAWRVRAVGSMTEQNSVTSVPITTASV